MEMFDGSISGEVLEMIENCDHSGLQIYKDGSTYIGICPVCGMYSEISERMLEDV